MVGRDQTIQAILVNPSNPVTPTPFHLLLLPALTLLYPPSLVLILNTHTHTHTHTHTINQSINPSIHQPTLSHQQSIIMLTKLLPTSATLRASLPQQWTTACKKRTDLATSAALSRMMSTTGSTTPLQRHSSLLQVCTFTSFKHDRGRRPRTNNDQHKLTRTIQYSNSLTEPSL
jgi:hypothetical protein